MVTPRTRRQPLEEDLDENNSINVYVPTPKSSKRRKRTEIEDSDMEDEEQVVTPSPKKRKILPVRAKDGEEERPSSSTRPVVEIPAMTVLPKAETPVSTKTKHHRFDSEEPGEEFFSTAPEKSTQDDEETQEAAGAEVVEGIEDSEDSEDDAPEAIGMQEAEETIKSREKDTAKAVKEQVNATKQKRKERDEALRKQSESAKKRKTKIKIPCIEINSEVDKDDSDAALDDANTAEEVIHSNKIPNNRSLSDLLPLEFLEDDDPEEVLAIEEAPKKAPKNKRKSRDLVEKQPKDRRIGGTTYRVTKAQSTNLAPKAAFNARSVKESWLQGRSGKKVDPNRKPISKGFFKK